MAAEPVEAPCRKAKLFIVSVSFALNTFILYFCGSSGLLRASQ
jgi:hypothetical protein